MKSIKISLHTCNTYYIQKAANGSIALFQKLCVSPPGRSHRPWFSAKNVESPLWASSATAGQANILMNRLKTILHLGKIYPFSSCPWIQSLHRYEKVSSPGNFRKVYRFTSPLAFRFHVRWTAPVSPRRLRDPTSPLKLLQAYFHQGLSNYQPSTFSVVRSLPVIPHLYLGRQKRDTEKLGWYGLVVVLTTKLPFCIAPRIDSEKLKGKRAK